VLFGLLLRLRVPTQLARSRSSRSMADLGWVGSLKALVIRRRERVRHLLDAPVCQSALPDELLGGGPDGRLRLPAHVLNIAVPVLRPRSPSRHLHVRQLVERLPVAVVC